MGFQSGPSGVSNQSGAIDLTAALAAKAALADLRVVQVVSAQYGTQTVSTSTSYADTGLTATITPSSTSNKILVLVHQAGCAKFSGASQFAGMNIKLQRAGSDIAVLASESGYNNTTNANYFGTVSAAYLDSPAATSAVVYKTVFATSVASNEVRVQQGSAVSTLTLLEVRP